MVGCRLAYGLDGGQSVRLRHLQGPFPVVSDENLDESDFLVRNTEQLALLVGREKLHEIRGPFLGQLNHFLLHLQIDDGVTVDQARRRRREDRGSGRAKSGGRSAAPL